MSKNFLKDELTHFGPVVLLNYGSGSVKSNGIYDQVVAILKEAGKTIRIYTTTTYEEPQYVVTYKKGDSWEWTDLETTFADGIISYTIADEQTATEIANRGLIFRGQAYTLTKITVAKEGTTGINTIFANKYSDVTYNLLGQKVRTCRGLIIKNGKKYIR